MNKVDINRIPSKPLVLDGLRIEAEVNDLTATITVTASYHNPHSTTVESICSIPGPSVFELGAGLELEVGDRNIEEGTVAMGENPIGVWTRNAGSVPPHEKVVARVDYSLSTRRIGNRVFLQIPSTLVPRDGGSAFAGIAPNPWLGEMLKDGTAVIYSLRFRGPLQGADFSSPSHGITVSRAATETVIEARETAPPAQDLMIEAVVPRPLKRRTFAAQLGTLRLTPSPTLADLTQWRVPLEVFEYIDGWALGGDPEPLILALLYLLVTGESGNATDDDVRREVVAAYEAKEVSEIESDLAAELLEKWGEAEERGECA